MVEDEYEARAGRGSCLVPCTPRRTQPERATVLAIVLAVRFIIMVDTFLKMILRKTSLRYALLEDCDENLCEEE